MLLNKKAVKSMINEYDKQVSAEYMAALEGIVKNIIIKSVTNARHFKRMTPSELLTLGG